MVRSFCSPMALSLVILLALLAGCGPQPAVQVHTLDLHRLDWERVELDVDFVETSWPGKGRSVAPEEFSVVLFDASYDTLYAGQDNIVSIPDQRLGDRERLIVEVCGTFESVAVCEQAGLSASPKRVLVDPEIEYPRRGNIGEGRYALRTRVERQQFDSEQWEVIANPGPLQTFLVAYVEDSENGAVRVPLRQSEGHFNLAQYANHSEFDFYLRSTLMNRDEVLVRFDVLASLNDQPAQTVATVERPVRRLTRAERAREVSYFAEQAAEQLLDALGISKDQTASVYIDEWNFMEGIGRYRIRMEMRWRGGFLGFAEHRLHGQLEVQADGSRPRFRRTDANRRGARLWGDHLDSTELELEQLERPVMLESPRMTDDHEEPVYYDPTRNASRPALGQ